MHLGFAVLAGDVSVIVRVSGELKGAVTVHFDELMRRADEHGRKERSTPTS
jgi:hypothetical protein